MNTLAYVISLPEVETSQLRELQWATTWHSRKHSEAEQNAAETWNAWKYAEGPEAHELFQIATTFEDQARDELAMFEKANQQLATIQN